MSDDATLTEDERQRKQLRRVGYGIAVSGLLVFVVARISTRPFDILVYGLGGLAVATLVLEYAGDGTPGLSLGFLSGSFGVWMWNALDGGRFVLLGGLLVAAGLLNALLTPYFRAFGERLSGR